jgi:hypothetical protein
MDQSQFHPLREFYEAIDQWSRSISEQISRITESFDGPRKAIAEFVERNTELFDVLRSLDVGFPLLVEDMLSPLVRHGWYPDLELPFSVLSDLVDDFKEDPSAGENVYVEYLCRELDAIEGRLKDASPARTEVLSDAFNSHRSGFFYASIPVLIAQADGVVWEKLSILLYSSKREALRRRESELEESGIGLSEVLMWPLLEPTSLNLSKGERPRDFVGMNRHLVLHGEDTTYGSERNSLRAISHLLFVSDVLKSVPSIPTRRNPDTT